KQEAEKQLLKELRKGSLKIVMGGEKLKGEFALVKMQHAKDDNAWLLIKHKDDFAVTRKYSSEEFTYIDSPINKALKEEGKKVYGKLKKSDTQSNRKRTDPATVKEEAVKRFGDKKVELTHLNKVYFPENGILKKDIIDYYQAVSKYILPYLKNRPESL